MTPAQPGTALAGARRLPLDLVDANPAQPRQVFDVQADAELRESIAQDGVIEPVIVRPHPTAPGRYLLVAGERRSRAARAAGLTDLPAIIREDLDDTTAYFLTVQENLQRASLDIEDEARQFQELLRLTGLSQRKLAERLGIDHTYLARRVKMLEERPDLFPRVRSGELTWREALDLLHGATVETPGEVLHGATGADTGPTGEVLHGATAQERAALDTGAGRNAFRWRPWQTFATVVARTRPEDVPADERATFEAQLGQLEAQIQALRRALRGE
jgi:ParB/RepB/Spo0J family partition protein